MTKAIRFFIIVTGVLMTSVAFSQENFQQGYIIQLNGNKLEGSIDFKKWKTNPDNIIFRDAYGITTSFTPLEINGFGVKNEMYESAKIEIETSRNKGDLRNTQLEVLEINAFLKAVVRGRKSLYIYIHSFNQEHFYIKQGSDYQLLVRKNTNELEEVTDSLENRTYVEQLTIYLQDFPAVQPTINKAIYTENSLKEVFESYYFFNGEQIDYIKKLDKNNTQVGVSFGMSLTDLTLRPEPKYTKLGKVLYDFLDDVEWEETSYKLNAGVSFDIFLKNNFKNWSVANNLMYTSFEKKGIYDEYESEDLYKHHFLIVEFNQLKMHNMIRFNYHLGALSLFVNVGASTGVAITSKCDDTVISKFYGPEKTETKSFMNYESTQMGYVYGAGVGFQNFIVEFRQEKAEGISAIRDISSSSSTNYFMIGYKF